jgi:hypothetical protein
LKSNYSAIINYKKNKNKIIYKVEYRPNNQDLNDHVDWADRVNTFLKEFEQTEIKRIKFDLSVVFDFLESGDFRNAKDNFRKLISDKYASIKWNHNRSFAYEFTHHNAIFSVFGYDIPMNDFKIQTILPSFKIVESFHLVKMFDKQTFLNRHSSGNY